ncbi:DUF2752 domain-containing protein [Larkinella sp. VNQ87]|uniref:DUF2752 domain-containing protein n=1 Tax=Larkinella sp. VNQ87 TaxID=3400921 RepID=UPI003C2EDBD0
MLTGLQCPGCGSQRCLHQLMHGHLAQAYGYNPLLVLSLPYVLVGLLIEYTPLRNHSAGIRHRFYGKTASWIAFAVVLAYWIGRNLA